MTRTSFVLAFLLALTACEGPIGPIGPAGPGTRVIFNGTTDQFGEGEVDLPAEAGTLESPPAITCYISLDDTNWLVVAVDTDATTLFSACVLFQGAGNLSVLVLTPAADVPFRVVVIY